MQVERVHAHGLYDLECDASTADARDCARQISTFLPRRPIPTAFERLRTNPRPEPEPCAQLQP